MTYDAGRTKAQDFTAKLTLSADPDDAYRSVYWRLAGLTREELLTIAAYLALQETGRRAVSDLPKLMGEPM